MNRLRSLSAALAGILLLGACGSRVTDDRLAASLDAISATAATATAEPGSPDTSGSAGAATPTGAEVAGQGRSGAAPAGVAVPDAGTLRTASGVAATAPGQTPAAASGTGRPGTAPVAASASAPGQDTGTPAPAAPDAGQGEIVLGSFGTGSGPIGAQVAAIPPAVRAWLADVNTRGGLGGHPVRVVFGDDRADPGRALALVRRMVEVDGVVAFVATYSVTTMDAVAPYLESKGVPVIGAPGGSTVEDHSPMIFNPTLGADHGIAWSYLLTISAQTDKKKLSVLYCREASTCTDQFSRLRELAPRLGLSVVHSAQISIVQPDFTAEVISARNAGAEVVVAVMDAQSMTRVISSAQRQGWKPVFSATHNLNTARFRSSGVDLDGTLAASATVPYTTSSRLAPYLAAMKHHAPEGEIGGYGSSAWAHLKLVETLVPAWAKPKPASADIVEALHGVRNESLGGLIVPISFNQGAHAAVNLCVVPLRYEKDGFKPPGGGDGTFACPPGYVAGDPAASADGVS
jgi:branched-chain amino acid transport system substrate-binding protein